MDDQTRLDLLTQHHELDVLLASDRDIATVRAGRFAPDAPAAALLNRWVEAADDLSAMISMRYEGEDPKKPFVDATPLSRPLRQSDVSSLACAASSVYGSLKPRYLRLWSAEQVGWVNCSAPDMRFMAAPLEWLRSRADSGSPPELALAPAESLGNYENAELAYDSARASYPHHFEQAALQSKDDLASTLEAGLLFDVYVEKTWAGYVAAMTSSEGTLGLPAYIVQELVLSSEFRGRGYGPHLTTLLARELDDERSVLLGTIHGNNYGALRAAAIAGRIDVGGWMRIPL